MSTIKPALHHVTMKTSRLDEMIKWYELVLGAKDQPGGTAAGVSDRALRCRSGSESVKPLARPTNSRPP